MCGLGRMSTLKQVEGSVANVKRRSQRRNFLLIIRVTRTEKAALNQAAAAQDVPTSQLIRRALKNVLIEVNAHE